MKSVRELATIICILGLITSFGLRSEAMPKSTNQYLESLSSNMLNSLIKESKQHALAEKAPESPPERKLSYESLTNSYLLGDSSDASTTNHLSMLVSQQRTKQNNRIIGNWLNSLEGDLDDLRDAVNRRMTDLATGLERRMQLLGHYNYMGQGMGIGGPGFPNSGQSPPPFL